MNWIGAVPALGAPLPAGVPSPELAAESASSHASLESMPASPVQWLREDRRRRPSKVRRSPLFGGTSGRERRLAPRLDSELAPIGVVLHGCRLRGADQPVDHLIVAPSGIWVVVADHSTGRVSIEHDRLLADGIDLSRALTSAAFAAQRVRQVLVGLRLDWLDVTASLCFTNARLKLGRVDSMSGVRLLDARSLVRDVALPGALLQADARHLAGVIGAELVIDGSPIQPA